MKSKFILLLALIMGIITTILFFNYSAGTVSTEPSAVEIPTTTVVKAIERINENQIITTEMLEVVEVADENIHAGTLKEVAEIEGKFATTVIEMGEIILSHHVKDQLDEKIFVSRKIKEGYRAVSVGLNNVKSVTNLIEPEDYVDIYGFNPVKPKDSENNEVAKMELLFSKVRVLAVGRKMVPPSNDESTYQEYAAVTFEMLPDEAEVLINSSLIEDVHLTLHPSVAKEIVTEEVEE